MKKLLFIASALMLCVGASAQHEIGTLTIQPKAGVNIANYASSDDSDPRIGIVAGAEFEYQLTKLFSLSAGALYSMQGAKESGTYEGVKADVTAKTDYINIPILANVYVAKGLALKFGLQPAFNVKAGYSVSAQGVNVSGSLSDFGVSIKSFDFSIPVGLSYEFNHIVVDGRYNLGVTKMVDGDDSKHSVFQFTVGYKFSL
ncbi:MAG: PorT family protein [Prevotella sp.]|nr:PorT family protein [Prevotella sp.]MBR1463800.1 PorT family protein [Prevotella sp.]